MERMSWLSKLTPRGAAQRPPRRAGLQGGPLTADPETCMMVFQNHWGQVLRILERRGAPPAPDDLSVVRNNSFQLLQLLAQDRPRGGTATATATGDVPPGPILEFVASENLLERLLGWHLQGDFTEERKVEQLKLYEMLISQAHQPLLRHRAVLTPLLRLLGVCSAPPASPQLQASLVLLLNQLCGCVAKEPSILQLLFRSPTEQGPANLIIFSLLIPFIHHEGALGQQARDALLLVMAMSAGNREVATSITNNSYFCPVLATGLSALYSSLPRRLDAGGDEWHCLRPEDWMGVSSIVLFMNSLEFCNAVIQVAHPLVQQQLVDYVHDGFLVPVMGPALHKTSVEEMIASTAYLELFLRSLSAPPLLKTFLRFLLLHRHDGAPILDTLVGRIASSSRLCMVSLSLFRTLLSLHCEDVMLQLVLRYLLPCSHLMLSQRRAVRDLDLYGRTAAKFLSLVPRCCRPPSPPPAPHRGAASPKPLTPSRLSFFSRVPPPQISSSTPPASPPPTPSGPHHPPPPPPEVLELEGNYLEYLRDAGRGVERCAWACRAWSAPYDGDHPGPPTPSSPPRTKKRGLQDEEAAAAAEKAPPDLTKTTPEPRGGDTTLVNGAHDPPETPDLGRGQHHLDGGGVKKVWCSSQGGGGNGDGDDEETPPQQPLPGKGAPPAPPRGSWDPLLVDSLLEELLAPAPPQQPEPPSTGGGVTIEAFTQELREIEAQMNNGGDDTGGALTTPPEPPEEEDEEEEDKAFTALAEGGGSRGGQGATRLPDPLVQLGATPPRALGAPPSQPSTGPFVSVLFGKLENMPQNSLYVNFLLTGLVAQLATYPQPLLRSFLLNTNLVFQPSVKSLIQVLGSVKNKLEVFAAGREDFPALLLKAKKFLIARGRLDWTEPPGTVHPPRRPDSLARSRRPSLGELILRHAQSPGRSRPGGGPQAPRGSQQPRDGSGGVLGLGGGPQGQALRVKNAVYCAVIFCEFLKELAAIAQAHAVTSPFLAEPPDE